MFTIGSGGESGDDLGWLVYSPAWKADVLPLDEPWRGAKPARAMLVVIGEGNVVLQRVLRASAVAQPGDAARVVADAVHAVARRAGGYPRRVLVRSWAAAALLAGELDAHHVDVRVAKLREAERMIRHLGGLLDAPATTWDLGPVRKLERVGAEALDEYFRAAARFWNARPWETVRDDEAFLARCGGREAAVEFTHPRGHGHVLTVYTSASDFPEVFDAVHPVFGVRFTRRARDARRLSLEPSAPLPHPAARPYPLLLSNREWRGPSAPRLRLVSAVLSAVAALAEQRRQVGPGLVFTDAESGVELRLESDCRYRPWPRMRKAGPGCATGPAADPSAALRASEAGLRAPEEDRLVRYAAHLEARRPRSWAAARHLRHAREWTRFLISTARVPAGAATEYDLRTFLYDAYPRTTREEEAAARALPASLRRYFRFLGEEEGISYPWAAAVLREREVYVDRLETAPLSGARDEVREWLAPLHADLDSRVMLPDRGFPGEHIGFDAPASRRVKALSRELLRRCQLWRDEAIREGAADAATLRAALVRRQREWERMPHPGSGRSPLRMAAEAE